MHTLKLRSYQLEAIAAIREHLDAHTRTAVVLPTGMGKTVVFSHLIAQTIETTGKKVVVLVHRDELAEQAASKVRSVAPDAVVGIVKAERNEIDADVLVCSVQTLARPRRREMIDPDAVGMVIVDECHHALARSWREVLDHFGKQTVGFTATLARGDGLGLGDVWESVAYERSIEYGIDHGFLSDVRGQSVTIDGFDLATIAKSRGDYQEGKLGDALISVNAGSAVAEAYREFATAADGSIRRGILFAPTVASAFHFADALNAEGIATETITGETSKEDRELAYKKFAAGDLRVLSNCMVLTEGFDAPHAEVAVIARPTQSAPLYTQMVGRVLRPFPGKVDALVLDVVGIAGKHALKTLKDLTTVPVNEGESITEAQERIAVEREEAIAGEKIAGERKSRVVELFAASHSVWLQTKGGTYFIPFRGGVVCLWTKDGIRYSVGIKRDRQPGTWLYSDLDSIEVAMAWGEQTANEIDPTVATKDRAWRKAKPSDAQLDLAIRMRLAPVDELVAMRRGAVSDLLSIHFASRELKALDDAHAAVAS